MMVDQLIVRLAGDSTGLVRSTTRAAAALNTLDAKAAGVGARMTSLSRTMTMRLTLPIVGAMAAATAALVPFDAQMRNVNVIAKQNEAQFLQTTNAVRSMAVEMGKGHTDLATALYNINSASFKGKEGLEVLEAAASAAKAGLATTAEAAKSITAALNSYGMEARKAADVSDVFFKTIELGVTTFPEIAASIGQTVSTAAAAKVPFEQMMAAIATMTRGGIGTAEAFTALNRFIMRLITSSTELDAVFQELGYDSAAAALQVEGLGGTVAAIEKATGGSAIEIQKLGFMIRDFKAATSLTRGGGKDFAGDLEAIATQAGRAGATAAALAEQEKSLAEDLRRAKAAVVDLSIGIGQALQPLVKDLAGGVRDISKALGSLNPEVVSTGVKIGIFFAAIGPGIGLVTKLAIKIKGLATAYWGLSAAIAAVNTAPVATGGGAALAATAGAAAGIPLIAGAAAGLVWMTKKWQSEVERVKKSLGGVLHIHRSIQEQTGVRSNMGILKQAREAAAAGDIAALDRIGKAFPKLAEIWKKNIGKATEEGVTEEGVKVGVTAAATKTPKQNPVFKAFREGMGGVVENLQMGRLGNKIQTAITDALSGTGGVADVLSLVKQGLYGISDPEKVSSYLQSVQSLLGGAFASIGQGQQQQEMPRVQFAGAAEYGSQAAYSAIMRHRYGMRDEDRVNERIAKSNEQQEELLDEIIDGLESIAPLALTEVSF